MDPLKGCVDKNVYSNIRLAHVHACITKLVTENSAMYIFNLFLTLHAMEIPFTTLEHSNSA